MKYKRYENYKDSNEEWIGIVPESWIVEPIREFYDYRSEKVSDKIYAPLSVTKQGILPQLENAAKTDNNDSRKKVKKGDFVINSRSDRKGSCGVSPYEGSVSLIYHVLSPKDKNITKYSHYLFRSVMFAEEFYKWGHGIVDDLWSTKWEDMKKIKIPMPPIDEMKIIVDYLDKKIKNIDDKLYYNKKLVDLLEEKRTALINQVVTKGLNPEVPMKDSGIEWIGEIPEHWETNKIKNMSYVKGRIGWHGLTSEEYSDEGAYLVTGTDFAEGTVDWNHCNHISYERYKQDPNIHLKEGDLLITKDGTIGKLALIKNIPDKATLNSGIFLVRPLKDNYTNEYLYWILSSDIFTRFFDYIKTGATIAHLYQETFERFFFPYMDIDEQNNIVDYLNSNISKINFTIKKVEENITLLEEYKTSLIHHVVTGKIDVRGEEI